MQSRFTIFIFTQVILIVRLLTSYTILMWIKFSLTIHSNIWIRQTCHTAHAYNCNSISSACYHHKHMSTHTQINKCTRTLKSVFALVLARKYEQNTLVKNDEHI